MNNNHIEQYEDVILDIVNRVMASNLKGTWRKTAGALLGVASGALVYIFVAKGQGGDDSGRDGE